MTQDVGKLLVGVNAVTDQAPTEAVEGTHDAEMHEAATLLGMDGEMSDVGFAFVAHTEAVTAGE